ncbi:hypothetical protein EYF80_028827 [Liparis tanakae]|uniref:Uncharacterized protein n=1 Tax=Liparis tanakae TaxID=230148 RepID=A0A4Z2H506_9TELE|nr:hypothetical protein EYF80_028827 [Liparis tanakae]
MIQENHQSVVAEVEAGEVGQARQHAHGNQLQQVAAKVERAESELRAERAGLHHADEVVAEVQVLQLLERGEVDAGLNGDAFGDGGQALAVAADRLALSGALAAGGAAQGGAGQEKQQGPAQEEVAVVQGCVSHLNHHRDKFLV